MINSTEVEDGKRPTTRMINKNASDCILRGLGFVAAKRRIMTTSPLSMQKKVSLAQFTLYKRRRIIFAQLVENVFLC